MVRAQQAHRVCVDLVEQRYGADMVALVGVDLGKPVPGRQRLQRVAPVAASDLATAAAAAAIGSSVSGWLGSSELAAATVVCGPAGAADGAAGAAATGSDGSVVTLVPFAP